MEEPPAPSSLVKEEKPLKKINLEIKSNLLEKYSINITGYQSYIDIKIKLLNKEPNKEYEEKFYLDRIKKISKFFLICDSISEVISSIEPSLKQSNIIKDNNHINLIIPLIHPLCKEAIFQLKEKIKIFDSTELYNMIIELRLNNQNQQNIINNQQEMIKDLQYKVDDLIKRLNILEKKSKQKEEVEIPYLNDSKIIGNDYEKVKSIKNWINPYKNLKFELLFRKSRDGSSCKTFHKYCDDKGPTLTLVETTKGYKFGGYTPFSFKNYSENSPKNDNETFIFSLNLMKKFKKIRDESLVFFDSDFGPCFGKGGSDFYLEGDLNSGYTLNRSFLINSELTNGESGDFRVKELEIYKIT